VLRAGVAVAALPVAGFLPGFAFLVTLLAGLLAVLLSGRLAGECHAR
jgi:hypothetical protein